MKFIKKRGNYDVWSAVTGGMMFEINKVKESGVHILTVCADDMPAYSSLIHSKKMFDTRDEAISFAEQIHAGNYDWKADIKIYEQRALELKNKYEAEIRNEAENFLGIIRERGISVDTFIELYEQFENMRDDARQEIFIAAGDHNPDKILRRRL
jgi:hypothetical protein